jgi:hypothetical protein
MYYIGLDVHKKTISYCVKDASGRICQEGKVGATRWELDIWIKTLPQPWTVAMEATIFTGWIYDHLKPHAADVKVAHPLMLRAIAAAKKKNDSIDASKIADCLRCDFLCVRIVCLFSPDCYRTRPQPLHQVKDSIGETTANVFRKARGDRLAHRFLASIDRERQLLECESYSGRSAETARMHA